MRVLFVYPAFERHAQAYPELKEHVPCEEYIGSPSLGIASIAACTPKDVDLAFVDDRIHPFEEGSWPDADLYAFSFFTPAATRAMDLGDRLRAEGKTVVMGGIFPSMMPEEAAPHADAVVVGEGETIWPQLIADARAGTLKARYQADEPADLAKLPRPLVELYLDAEDENFQPDDYPLQISRGCPFNCDSCVIPCVMGRKIRFFPEETVWETLKAFAARGKRCCLTEDTSLMFLSGARRRFRKLLRRIAEHRDSEGIALSYIGTSMPLLLNLEDEIFEEIRAAGIERFYLVGGFDPITRAAFGPGDAKATEQAERCVKRCQDAGVEPYVSFLVGNEEDDEGTFDRMLEFSNRVKLQIAEFAVATPYPGTPMWDKMIAEDRIIDRTWRRYNDTTVVFQPRNMSPERLQQGYLDLWRLFYESRQELKMADRSLCTIQF